MGSRSQANAEAAIEKLKQECPASESVLTPVVIDVTDDASIEQAYAFVVKLGIRRLDVLINNAGANVENIPSLSLRSAFAASWDINVTGAHIVTHTFMPLLLLSPSPYLLFNTSGLSTLIGASLGQNGALVSSPPAGWPKPPTPMKGTAYRASKAGLNMLMLQWKDMLRNDGVKCFCISPGFLATGLTGKGNEDRLRSVGAGEPRLGGELMREVVEGRRDRDEGRVVNANGVQDW